MDNIPIDVNHPVIREYLSLVRLQVLTPLSLLINVAVIVACSTIASPTIAQVSEDHITTITPNIIALSVYATTLAVGQLGLCLLLAIVRKEDTKKTLVHGMGLPLPIANLGMALAAVAWVFQWLTASVVLHSAVLAILFVSNIRLLFLYPPAEKERPLDTLLIHAPLRFFLVLQLNLLFPLALFIKLGLESPDTEHIRGAWPGFFAILATNVLGLAVVLVRGDIVWAVACTWINISQWTIPHAQKPPQVTISAMLFTVALPLALLARITWDWMQSRQRGAIGLSGDDHPGLDGHHNQGQRD